MTVAGTDDRRPATLPHDGDVTAYLDTVTDPDAGRTQPRSSTT